VLVFNFTRPFAGVSPVKILEKTEKGECSMKMKIRPLQDYIIIKRLEEEQKTAGGIIIPDTAQEKPAQGEVIAVGPGRRMDDGTVSPVSVAVGDKVIFRTYAGSEIKYGGEELTILAEHEVYAVIE
jgi:chaperonin GroES